MALAVAATPLVIPLRGSLNGWTFRWRAAEFALLLLSFMTARKTAKIPWETIAFPAWISFLALGWGGQYHELQALTVLSFMLIWLAMRDGLDEETLTNAVSVVLIAECLFALWQSGVIKLTGAPAGTPWLWPFVAKSDAYHPGGTIGNVSTLGVYIAVAWPLLWRSGWKWAVAIVVATALVTKSHTALVAMGVVAVAWAPREKRFLIGIAGIGLILLAGPFDIWTSAKARWDAWIVLAPVLDKQPVWGNVLGSFTLSAMKHSGRWVHPHNEWIQIAYDTGAFGLIVLSLSAWPLVHKLRHSESENAHIWRASMFGLFLASFTMFPFRMAETVFLGMAVLALACRNGVKRA